MKKIIAAILCMTILMSLGSLSAFAWAPTDFRDPKCIDLNSLGTYQTRISYGNKKICGCKTCTVDALTYVEIESYLDGLEKKLNHLGGDIVNNTRLAIKWEAGKYAAIDVVLFTDAVAAKFNEKVRGANANPWAKGVYGVIMISGAVFGFICQGKQSNYEMIVLEDKVKLSNIEQILKALSDKIEKKMYQDMNFVLISTNYSPNQSTAIAQFARKDGIETTNYYGVNYYNEEYFNKINKEKIKPLIKQIEAGEFRRYENAFYDTKFRDFFKHAAQYTFVPVIVAEAFNLYKRYKVKIDPVLKDKTKSLLDLSGKTGKKIKVFAEKNKLSVKQLRALFKFLSQESGKSNNPFIKGIHWLTGSITVVMDADSDTNDGEESSNTDKTSTDEKTQASSSTDTILKLEKIDINGSKSASIA